LKKGKEGVRPGGDCNPEEEAAFGVGSNRGQGQGKRKGKKYSRAYSSEEQRNRNGNLVAIETVKK